MSKIFKSLNDVATVLKQGAVGVLPTDTLYGLVCRAADQAAVKRLYSLKSRETNPGTVIAASISQFEEIGIKHRYVKAVEELWPNALSIVIPCGEELSYLHLGRRGLALRIPKEKNLLKLLQKTGPLLTTSANHPSQPPADTIEEAQKYFGGNVDFYVDGGDLSGRQPSTVIRVVDDAIEILRAGAVNIDESGKIKK